MVPWSSFSAPARFPPFKRFSSWETMGSSWLPQLAGMARVSRVNVRRRLPSMWLVEV